MESNMNQSAFPIQGFSTRNGQGFQAVMSDGMTLRDYFAAKAMQGICARVQWSYSGAAEDAYAYADAMLKARER
jgi:hypothetical protein